MSDGAGHRSVEVVEKSSVSPTAEREARAFVVRENDLADQGLYTEWLGLWTPGEVCYWVPSREDADPAREISVLFDDRKHLEQRVTRWESGVAWSQDPRSSTCRITGNVEVTSLDSDGLCVGGKTLYWVSRRGRVSVLAARVEYLLKRWDGALSMYRKKTVFADPDMVFENITFII